MTPSPFGGCKPSNYGSGEIAVTTSSGEARHHRIARFSLAVRQGSFHDTDPYLRVTVVVMISSVFLASSDADDVTGSAT